MLRTLFGATPIARRAASRGIATSAESTRALVLGELTGGELAASTRQAARAARALGGDVAVLLAGEEDLSAAAAAAAALPGVSSVLVARHGSLSDGAPAPLAALLAALQGSGGFSHIVGGATSVGRDALPRAAALLGAEPVADVVAVRGPRTFVRPIYAGAALETVRVGGEGPVVVTARLSAFRDEEGGDAGEEGGGGAGARDVSRPSPPRASTSDVPPKAVEAAAEAGRRAPCRVVREGGEREAAAGEGGGRPQLPQARVVVSGGRGLRDAEGFALAGELASALGGALGASRAAVDAGWAPNELQVGQTGQVVAPDLYVALGISGAIQHVAGIKGSRLIVAINNDPEAPIFKVADIGLVGDAAEVVPRLLGALGEPSP